MADSSIGTLDENASPTSGDWFVFELANNSAANRVDYDDLKAAIVGAGTIEKALDEDVSSSTTLQDDDELQFAATAGKLYEFVMVLLIDAASNTPDFKFEMLADGGGSTFSNYVLTYVDASSVETIENNTGGLGSGGITGEKTVSAFTSSPRPQVMIRGAIVVSTNCTAKLRWAQNTSSADATTVKAGSFIKYQETG